MKTATYTISNISCNHCIHTIKSELSELAGVKSVEADLNSKKVIVEYDTPANEEKIINLLTEINYPPI